MNDIIVEGRGPNCQHFESPWPKEALCHVWLKLADGFGEDVENVKSLQTDVQT